MKNSIRTAGGSGTKVQGAGRGNPRPGVSARGCTVFAMLSGTPSNFPPAEVAELESELSKLHAERPVIEEALKMQRTIRDGIKQKLSQQILQPYVAEHRRLVNKVRETALAVVAANEAEHAFRESLKDQNLDGVDGLMRPMGFMYVKIGLLREHHSMISMYLRECEEFGFTK
jgi:hypothetical protein